VINLRNVQVFMVRFLVDPNDPHQLMGTIYKIPQGEAVSFQNEKDLLQQIYTVLENQALNPEEKHKPED
jgi:hypothetical protein